MLKPALPARSERYHSRRILKVPLGAQRFLAAFEGFEGGFAIGASIVVGLSLAGYGRETLLATAFISLIVSGFNSASVKYSSEHYLDELDGREKKHGFRNYFAPAVIEFVSYTAISLVSIIPLLLIGNITTAVWACVGVTLVLLFLAGFWRGYMLRTSSIRDGIETALLGGGIIVVGLVSGLIVNSL
ncbi:MAG TPA: VIT1/CCC1 transporter family protein [Candidatus Saccharibacteria bacterium]|mgnify:FL=1|nr:VIT1/CCC1 transporter family protein [Candidatus Saccharibacteria bacterium]HRK94251.1 VIT1/CCC1 transporter family protein [Candidatus Saccharibacteria bacterium]